MQADESSRPRHERANTFTGRFVQILKKSAGQGIYAGEDEWRSWRSSAC